MILSAWNNCIAALNLYWERWDGLLAAACNISFDPTKGLGLENEKGKRHLKTWPHLRSFKLSLCAISEIYVISETKEKKILVKIKKLKILLILHLITRRKACETQSDEL